MDAPVFCFLGDMMQSEDRYDSLFQFYGAQNGVDWKLLKAQVRAESGFDPDARSKCGAVGLAQFMARTWEEWRDGTPGVQGAEGSKQKAEGSQQLPNLVNLDPRDPEDAIRAQAAYMAWLLRRFGDNLDMALAAYNWGAGNLAKAIRQVGPLFMTLAPKETRDYTTRITRFRQELA